MAGKHTPGPWSVYSWDDKGTPVIGVKPVEGGGDVADCSVNNWRGIDVLEANARLIAAAPDLLEALIELRGFAARVADGVDAGSVEEYIEQADAAITRATQPLPTMSEE